MNDFPFLIHLRASFPMVQRGRTLVHDDRYIRAEKRKMLQVIIIKACAN